jgi:hypothetical protein
MKLGGWSNMLAMASSVVLAVSAVAWPAAAQQQTDAQPSDSSACPAPGGVAEGAFGGFEKGLPRPPCSEPSLPPGNVIPFVSKTPSDFAAPAGPPLVADTQVASTELGFEQGVAPAPGRSIMYNGRKYRVVDVTAKGGGPTFAGGSPFVIGVIGARLTVGLKAIVPGSSLDPDRFDASVVN